MHFQAFLVTDLVHHIVLTGVFRYFEAEGLSAECCCYIGVFDFHGSDALTKIGGMALNVDHIPFLQATGLQLDNSDREMGIVVRHNTDAIS